MAAAVAAIRRKRTEIKRALLDQTVVSGIGNIYADEALWRAKVHYARPTAGMTRAVAGRVLTAATRGDDAGAGRWWHLLRRAVRQRQRRIRVLRPVAERLRPAGSAVPAVRHPDPPRRLHEPVVVLLPALPASAPRIRSALRGVLTWSVRAIAPARPPSPRRQPVVSSGASNHRRVPRPSIVPAAVPVAKPVDHALRLLTKSADHGRLWMGIAAVGVLAGKRTRRASLRGMATLGAASFVSNVLIKPLIGRRRPDPERTSIARRIGHLPWTSSFPSGHAASAAAFAAGATMELPAAGAVLIPLAAAVAYSRVHVGVHYRSDVWAGAAVGLTLAVVGRALWPVKPWGPALMAAGHRAEPARRQGSDGDRQPGLRQQRRRRRSRSPGAAARRGSCNGIRTTDLASLIDDDAAGARRRRRRRHRGRAWRRSPTTAGLPLAVFPSGTLNHFAKALGPGHRRAHRRRRGGGSGRRWSTWRSSTVSGS